MGRLDINDLLERYAKGETTAEENLQVENWLAGHQNTDNEWERMNAAKRQQWLDEVFADVTSTIDQDTPVISMRPRRTLWRVAAVAAMLLVCVSLFWQRNAIQGLFGGPALTSLQTAFNEKKQVVLSDGSKIWLNSGSELKYPEKFNGRTREVYLKGEAYFDIQHDDRKAFIVHTGNLITTVLGTAFNINAGGADKQVVVTVTRGKVSVSEGKHLLGFITPNQQISYNVQSKVPVKTKVDASQAIAWRAADMHFDDITFEEAASQLSERFKVKIMFGNDRLKKCRFSGTALSGKNIDQVLKVICAFNNANYHHQPDGSININGAGCN